MGLLTQFKISYNNPSCRYIKSIDTMSQFWPILEENLFLNPQPAKPNNFHLPRIIYNYKINTPLGVLVAYASEAHLIALDFEETFKGLPSILNATPCINEGILLFKDLKSQIDAYFNKELLIFTIPLLAYGTFFQAQAYQALLKIPYGETISYSKQAEMMNKDKNVVRAVANANGSNDILILVPCHRVKHKAGTIGGFKSGVDRKLELIKLERNEI